MGLFDRFKKQKNEEIEETVKAEEPKVAEEPKAAEEIKSEATNAEEPKVAEAPKVTAEAKVMEELKEDDVNTDRPFTLLVEDLSVLPEEKGVVVGGITYGMVQRRDTIYVIHPMGNISLAFVEDIEIGPNETAAKAEDQKVKLFLKNIKNANQIPKYTVLTSIKPQTTVDVNTAVENPQLLGLSMDYPRLCKDNTYLNLLVYVICHAHYVIPVSVDKEPEITGDGTETFKKETRMRFPSLQDPNDNSKNVFPLFTDWKALSNWKNVFDENHPPRTIIMRFPDAINVCRGNAMVINPFGPTMVMLSENTIKQIVSMDGYKQEFGENAAESVQKVEGEQEAKIVVGIPKETSEIKMIKDALVVQARFMKEVKRVDFLLKVDVQKERAYLCIVDCPEEEATRIFTGLHKAAAPYFNEVKRMEFLLNGKSKLANDVTNEKSCIYEA